MKKFVHFRFQLTTKQDQLVRYDQILHEAEIKAKYAKEECFIQEKEIVRLNTIQEEHENKIKKLQEDLIKLQEEVRSTQNSNYWICKSMTGTVRFEGFEGLIETKLLKIKT